MSLRRISAYAAIYLLWGGAYLAVRALVQVLPAFLVAGVRYGVAAILLAPLLLIRRDQTHTWRQMFNALWTGALMLAVGYGVVFWAEKSLPSWIVATLVSTSFLWTYLGESLLLRTYRFQLKMLLPLLAGLAGTPLLVGISFRHDRISVISTLLVLGGALSWAAGSLAVKRIDMPRSYIQTATYQLAIAGLLLLLLSGALGEWTGLPSAAQMFARRPILAMIYLVIGASVISLAAYHWLLAREPASLVATFAYVNPIVAMVLGIAAAHESYMRVQIVGACIVLGSIIAVWYLQGHPARPVVNAPQTIPDR